MGENEDAGQKKTLEELCREASFEMDSAKLRSLVEQIDFLLDEEHKAKTRRPEFRKAG